MATLENSSKLNSQTRKRSHQEMIKQQQQQDIEVNEPPNKKTKMESMDGIYQIEMRYNDNNNNHNNNIKEISSLVFKECNNNNNLDDKLKYDITDYLYKIGICVVCIYRICNQFESIYHYKKDKKTLLKSLIEMEQKTNILSKNCFICNDIYLKLYQSLKDDKFLSKIDIEKYEFKSYSLTINIPSIITVRDFYIIHHLHHQIDQSSKLIILPNQNKNNTNKDLIHFMIDNYSKHLKSISINNNDKNKFEINMTFSFYHDYISSHFEINDNIKDHTQTKQAKKREKFKSWNGRKNKKKKVNENKKPWNDTKCIEYKLIASSTPSQWFQYNHYLNSLKLFLRDFTSFKIMAKLCNDHVDKEKFLKCKLLPFETNNNDIDVKIEIQRSTIFIAGEYNKYSREISQTPFAYAKSSIISLIVEQMRKFDVDPIIKDNTDNKENKDENIEIKNQSYTNINSKILNPASNIHGWINLKQDVMVNNIFCSDRVILHSGGREDMNVRMLGKGRPLLLQLINPRKPISLINTNLNIFQQFCNSNVDGMIQLRNLRIVDEKYQEWLKSIENTKKKEYRALCWISKSIKNQKELDDIWKKCDIKFPLKLKQSTPIRVLHRRSVAIRDKQLFNIKLKWISSQWISVDILAEAGTYIKEFCHGDRGRTIPNLNSLLNCRHSNIIQLDVLSIQ